MKYAGFYVLTLLSCFFILSLSPAQAQQARVSYLSAKDLLDNCVSEDTISHKICENYIAGVVDYHNLILSIDSTPTVDICLPQGVTIEALRVQIGDYLSKNNQHESFNAAPAVIMGLFEHYPCQQ